VKAGVNMHGMDKAASGKTDENMHGMDQTSGMDAVQVENLVKKALAFSEEEPEKRKVRKKKYAAVFSGCVLVAALEMVIGLAALSRLGMLSGPGSAGVLPTLLTLEALSFIFGFYLWFAVKERLPAYYDENKISAFSDGIFRINMPGVYFNNGNWPYIVKALRIWQIVTMLAVPPVCMLVAAFVSGAGWALGLQMTVLVLYLAGLFVPVYIVGRKYENAADGNTSNRNMPDRKKTGKIRGMIFLGVLVVIAGLFMSGIMTFNSGVRIGFASSGGLKEWQASYQMLDGIMRKKIYPGSEPVIYTVEIQTEQGEFLVEIKDKDNQVIFSESSEGSYAVTLTGTSRVEITADHHKGHFSVSPQKGDS